MTTDAELWQQLERVNAWLDDENRGMPGDDEMRIMKLAEEVGEVAQAYIGMKGQNPRKGVTHTMDDVLTELADVAGTALCAIQHFTQDVDRTREILVRKFTQTAQRTEGDVED